MMIHFNLINIFFHWFSPWKSAADSSTHYRIRTDIYSAYEVCAGQKRCWYNIWCAKYEIQSKFHCLYHVIHIILAWKVNVFIFTKIVYKLQVIHCTGNLRVKKFQTTNLYGVSQSCTQNLGLVAVGHSFPSSSLKKIELRQDMFMFRASADLKFMLLDDQ